MKAGLLARKAAALILIVAASACTRPASPVLETGKPVFQFDYEKVQELLISRGEPGQSPWTARLSVDGWLGPQQVTPRWRIQQAPEGQILADSLADGSFVRHLLDSLRGLRKTAGTPEGDDAGFGLLPAWTRLEWKEGEKKFEILLGSNFSGGGRYARIGNERLVVNGATLDMLGMVEAFERTRYRKLFTWTLDDADRVTIRWSGGQLGARKAENWSGERQTGDWAKSGGKAFSKSPDPQLEAVAHLQIDQFELAPETFSAPAVAIEWVDRNDHRLLIEVDANLMARSSDRPGTVFRLHPGAREILTYSRFPR